MKRLKEYLKLMRVKHYIKNILLFLPLFFSGKLIECSLYFNLFIGFACFSLVCSTIYIFNDIHDVEKDKKHPIKKNRPIASGKVTKSSAVALMMILIIGVVLINVICLNNNLSYLYLIIYFVMNILYSLKLKHVPILDVCILSFGFIIRVLYGGAILNIPVSNWLFLTILCGALFMSMGKRRNELQKNNNNSREVLKYYSVDFLNKNMYMFLGMTLIFFSLWTLEQKETYVWCIPLVFMLCMRYSLDVESSPSYGDPVDVILSDKVLIALLLLSGITMSILIYVI